MHKADIPPDLAARLVAEQFPRWAHLPVTPVDLGGWDNTTFRLGRTLSIRLPSHDAYVPQVDKEHRWLPRLAPQVPLPIPQPLAKGEPSDAFPRPWSVYRWLDGEPATADRVADPERFAVDLAGFLRALQRIDAGDGPTAGPHSFNRGGPVGTWDRETRDAIASLDGEADGPGATAVWEAALAAEPAGTPVWVHGDVTGSNLLVAGGRLTAVIDFGCCAVGDPACDLTIAWTLFSGASRDAFRATVSADGPTWARARGWALWKAIVTIRNARRLGTAPEVAAARFGWSASPAAVLADVIDDHRRATAWQR